ncbi:cytochrome b [Labrys okinawensis]|uniref:cytochrome b n=1 Tax=Labrys okinawensis TaxID=346911 RepID=UPI0039BCB255
MRYHPLLVALHWVSAVLVIATLFVGFGLLATTPNEAAGKIAILRWHMAGGMLILALTIIRLVVRWRSSKPAAAPTGNMLLDRLATPAHYGLYLLIVLMVATGYATGILAGLPAIVFANSGDPLPPSFAAYPTFTAHLLLALLLTTLIALHIAAALYHHLVLKDGLFRRMNFGRRS